MRGSNFTEKKPEKQYVNQVIKSCHQKDISSRGMLIFGEGNGTPLQCSCLENPMDRGACWAAVHGVLGGGREVGRKENKKTRKQFG